MSNVQIIKANRDENRIRGRKVEILRVAAYCRVSTDSEDQLNSYKSQVMYYTELINKKPEWSLAGIYADEAITGTQVTKREDFQRMINDCMNGEIDMIITKSISRFARNTLDTLKYVRMLKEKGIAVFFEDENINTLTMDGELLLVVLSSVAQQEVENISSNVKKGLKMKMQRGELVGFQGCLGYDYNKETKSISVNEKEAEIVRYIFNRYIEGAGCTVIANELENLGYKTKCGSSRWVQSTVIGIIKNEKYKGDVLLGKTFTVDPISKRRLENFGEEDRFYIQNHHEPIVGEEIFEEAQRILAKRNVHRGVHQKGQKRNKFSRKYAFSCMIKCGFCGGTLTRRNWHSSSIYTKTIWQCVTSTKKGKKYCPHCKGIPEEVIEKAFVKSYQLLCSDQQQVVEEFLQKVEGVLNEDTSLKRLPKIEKEMSDLRRRKEKLLDLRLDNNIDRDIYESKNQELSEQLKKLQEEQEQLLELNKNQESTKTRLQEFRKKLSSGEILESFDRAVFESVVEKIIIGGYNEEGVEEPLKITFVYKTGIHSNFNGKEFKPKRRNAAALHNDIELCSYTSGEAEKLYSYYSSDTSVIAEEGSTVTGIYEANDLEGDNVGGLIGFRGEGHIKTTGCSVTGVTVVGTRKVGGLIGSVFTNNIVEGCSVKDVEIVCNATEEYGKNNAKSMGIGGLVGLYTINGSNNGTLKNSSVTNISLIVNELDLANVVVMGYISGGQRGDETPTHPKDSIIVENVKVNGNNTGSNAEKNSQIPLQ